MEEVLETNQNMDLLCGIALWTIWIERNDKVFNHEQRHESNIKHRVWDDLNMYAKVAWKWLIKQVKISSFSVVALLEGFDKTRVARNVLYWRHNLHIEWN